MSTPWTRLFGYTRGRDSAELSTIELLSRVPLFEELSRRELAALEKILHRREYIRNELIFKLGELGVGMYIVQQGKVSIMSNSEEHELAEMNDGDFFGEIALLDESPRSATAIAKTDCIVFGFFQPDLFGLIARDPRLGMKIVLRVARHVGQRLRTTNERLIEMTAEIETLKRINSVEKS